MDDEHVKHMKRCYELAISAGKKGYDTFGAAAMYAGKRIVFHGDPQQFPDALGSVSPVSVCFIQQNENFGL